MNRQVIFAVILPVAIYGCIGPLSEKPERQYATAEEARADGALERGWIPEILPRDAHAIREVHDIATNLSWCCFSTEPIEDACLHGELTTFRANGALNTRRRAPSRDDRQVH